MFEVIISQVRTGRVERHPFGSLAEAELYAAGREEKLLRPRRAGHKPRSQQDLRIEIQYHECATVRPLSRPAIANAAA
jgi:hypothetical protein